QQVETRESQPAPTPPPAPRRRKPFLAVAFAIAVMLVGLGLYVRSSKNPPAALEGLASLLGNPNRALLKIDCDPAEGVKVFLDGKEVGTTPYSRKSSPGIYNYELRAEGYGKFATNIVLRPRSETGFKVRLQRLPVTVVLISNPIGAEIYRDGKLL